MSKPRDERECTEGGVSEPNARELERTSGGGHTVERLSLAAFAFVVVALIGLASIPAFLLQRVSRTNETLTEVLLPAYDAVNEFTVAMEQRIVATRSSWISGNPIYDAEYQSAIEREVAALSTLRRLDDGLGEAFQRDLATLRRLAETRDSLVATVPAVGTREYERALPRFDMIRDSMLFTASRLQSDLRLATRERTSAEARWIVRQQLLAVLLGLVALVAVVAVGRFALVQRRLHGEVQTALGSAERSRAEAEGGRAELVRVTESRNRLLRGFTHDVKNPLGAAQGFLDLLIEGIQGPLSDTQLRSVERARASVAAALGLVEELLELARAESGRLEVVRAPTDLAALAADLAEESRPLADAKGLALEIETPDAPVVVETDARRVRQVTGNLLSNAIKYTPDGAVTIRVEPSGDGGRAGIAVVDTGVGIPADKVPLLFQEFVRLDGGSADGVGVGLTISHRIAQALGGEITVDSEPGRGSTFTLWLPRDV